MSGHYDESTLYDYLDAPAAFAGREELEEHVRGCPQCGELLAQLSEFESMLTSTSTWEYAEAIRRHREPPEAIRTVADALSEEDEAAEELLAALVASPAAFRGTAVTTSLQYRTAGVVRRLCDHSRDLREKQPMHALTLADAAVSIAEQLPRERYPATLLQELRGAAWLERANVLRYLGRFPEAVDALDIAEHAYQQTPVPVYPLAIVQYVRSVVFVKSERFEEAARLARHAARVFRQFGEEDRYVHARMVEAAVPFHQNRFAEALALWLPLVPTAKKLGDAATLARLYSNVANCYLGLDDRSTAGSYFAQALSLYEALGMETEKSRTRWSLGRLLLGAGNHVDGLGRLRQTRSEFEKLGLTSDAALVTLDIVEVLLANGETAEAARLCAGLVESFTNVGMTGNALTALAFLREALAVGTATANLVQLVREYLEKLPENEQPFIPPPPL